MSKGLQLQLNGNVTFIKSKSILTKEDREKVLKASPGKEKALKLTFTDPSGNEVVLLGRLYEASSGNLTAKVSSKLMNFEIIEVDKKDDNTTNINELLSTLGV